MSLADTPDTPTGNAQPYSVSELAFALKRTLEDSYGFVRVRAELSKVTRHASGHCYLTLKDDKAAIDGVVWKGQVRGLACQPQQGMEVIVTGRITTYPASSKYQIVVETMEPAGVGALLAQLERLKAKLAGEGLFDAARKRPLPSMPATVGVITSPTGAVIRDILHRIRDRWPCHVLVWPVVVQGEAAAGQVCNAIRGFNALPPASRPDIIIVARGGGSVEDLWAFNDETLARTAAASAIPLISAVGHETDTTLIDFVSDRRAPTPTAAAEIATPVLGELKAAVADYQQRLSRCSVRLLEDRRHRLSAAARGLPRPADILALASQRFDLASGRLGAALEKNTSVHERDLVRHAARLTPALIQRRVQAETERTAALSSRLGAALEKNAAAHERDLTRSTARLGPALVQRRLEAGAERTSALWTRLPPAMARRLERGEDRLRAIDRLFASLDPERPPKPGFVMVKRPDGSVVLSGASLAAGDSVQLMFPDAPREAVIDGARKPKPTIRRPGDDQGQLF